MNSSNRFATHATAAAANSGVSISCCVYTLQMRSTSAKLNGKIISCTTYFLCHKNKIPLVGMKHLKEEWLKDIGQKTITYK